MIDPDRSQRIGDDALQVLGVNTDRLRDAIHTHDDSVFTKVLATGERDFESVRCAKCLVGATAGFSSGAFLSPNLDS